mmetsp:Transcript_37426/g.51716  ORF Transcript_37426/g.51716 Transcript_37426/m.51716 type:complete len:260 (-) Transcript_37426:1048-1827(-)
MRDQILHLRRCNNQGDGLLPHLRFDLFGQVVGLQPIKIAIKRQGPLFFHDELFHFRLGFHLQSHFYSLQLFLHQNLPHFPLLDFRFHLHFPNEDRNHQEPDFLPQNSLKHYFPHHDPTKSPLEVQFSEHFLQAFVNELWLLWGETDLQVVTTFAQSLVLEYTAALLLLIAVHQAISLEMMMMMLTVRQLSLLIVMLKKWGARVVDEEVRKEGKLHGIQETCKHHWEKMVRYGLSVGKKENPILLVHIDRPPEDHAKIQH